MATLDVKAIAEDLRREIIGFRLANIYDISNKVYAFKFTKTGVEGKNYLLVESGIRVHLTNWERDKTAIPSRLTLKLKKHLRTKRLDSIEQFGCDRVLDFKFVGADGVFHLLMEFYVRGNMILTDSNYKVMMLLRHAKMEDEDDEQMILSVGSNYPVEKSKNMPYLNQSLDESIVLHSEDIIIAAEHLRHKISFNSNQLRMREAVMRLVSFAHPALAEHSCIEVGMDPTTLYKRNFSLDSPEAPSESFQDPSGGFIDYERMVRAIRTCVLTYESVGSKENSKGYLAVEKCRLDAEPIDKSFGKEGQTQSERSRSILESGGWAVDDFSPIILKRCANYEGSEDKKRKKVINAPLKERGELEFDSFSVAVDVFFAKLETQKAERQLESKNSQTFARVDKIREDQQRRVNELAEVQRLSEKQADLIESNVRLVDAMILLVQELLAENDWESVERIVKEASRDGHPLALRISKFDFKKNLVFILLGEAFDEADADGDDNGEFDGSELLVEVAIDYSQSSYANVALHHSHRKQGKVKLEKTELAASKAIFEAERKAEADRQKEDLKITKAQILERRKVFWFEKFRWFISSENYLVLAGRDAQQNDILFRRYLEKNDIYIHADVQGAATCIVKNPKGGSVPPRTLQEAGQFSICHSNAWSNKRSTPAYWVHAEQVSKTAPTGEFLATGAFMIRGKKNFLPPANLEMGFAIMFQLGNDSLKRHAGERDRALLALDELDTVYKDRRIAGVDKYAFNEDDEESNNEECIIKINRENENNRNSIFSTSITNEIQQNIDDLLETEKIVENIDGDKEEELLIQLPIVLGSSDKKTDAFPDEDLLFLNQKNNIVVQKNEENILGSNLAKEKQIKDKIRNEKDFNLNNTKQKKIKNIESLSHLPRGQRSKLKKIKDKYKDQSEDEREACLALVGSKKMQRTDTLLKENFFLIDDKENVGEMIEENEESVEDEAAKQQQNELELKRQLNREKKERREIRALGLDDEDVAAEIQAKLKDIDQLTYLPQMEDSLLSAVPVCAPYLSLNTALFKVKLTPGKDKKGKVIQAAVRLMMQNKHSVSNPLMKTKEEEEFESKAIKSGGKSISEGVPAATLEMIRHLDVDAAQHCLIGDIKIASAGVLAVKLQDKKEKKVAAKQANADRQVQNTNSNKDKKKSTI